MTDTLQPQPWWVAVLGALLFTIRWLIGFGASSARGVIASQKEDLARLNARVEKLEKREEENLLLIRDLREQNIALRQALCRAGIDIST